MLRIAVFTLAALIALPVLAQSSGENERRVGYYYPEILSEETFAREISDAPTPGRAVRVGFITEITKAQLAAPDNPQFVIFAKGRDADEMIIVAIDNDIFKTLYRARAVLAQLTSNARGTDFFIKNRIAAHATWFDLAKLLGFRNLVISDGETWSHKIHFEQN